MKSLLKTLSALTVALTLLLSNVIPAYAAISLDTVGVTQGAYRNYEFFASTTAPSTVSTTTSATSTNIISFFTPTGVKDFGYFVIAGAKSVGLLFGRGDATGQGNAGSSAFRIQASPNGSDWYDYNSLTLDAITPGAVLRPIVGTTTITAATSTVPMFMNNIDGIYAIRCIVVEATDGEHRCRGTASF